MKKSEVVKEFIEKTKREVRERERVKEIIGEFFETFGFLPDEVEWIKEGAERILQATALEEENKETILGEKVEKVSFHLIEDRLYGSDEDWKYSSFTSGIYTVHKWSRNLKNYRAMVKIYVK